MKHKFLILISICFLIFAPISCKKNKITIQEEILEIPPFNPVIETNHYNSYSTYFPTDTFIQIKYSISSERLEYQFDEYNNNKKYLAGYEGYDENNNLIEYISYTSDGISRQKDVSVYENGLLKNLYRFSDTPYDKVYKFSYYYDTKNKLKLSTMAIFKNRLKKDTLNRYTDCYSDEDCEKFKTWDDFKVTEYKYDTKGNLTSETTLIDSVTVNKELYLYNDDGKILEHTSIQSDAITRQIKTKYYPGGSESTCMFNQSYYGYIDKKIFDKNNNLISTQSVHAETKNPHYSRIYFYNKQNKIIKELYVPEVGDTLKTLYTYKKLEKPIVKKIKIKKW